MALFEIAYIITVCVIPEHPQCKTQFPRRHGILTQKNLCFNIFLKCPKKKFGKPIKYVQYLVMYDMKWRLRTVVPSGVLTEEEKKQYLELLHVILQDIDDDMIATQKNCLSLHYLLAYQLKYQRIAGMK